MLFFSYHKLFKVPTNPHSLYFNSIFLTPTHPIQLPHPLKTLKKISIFSLIMKKLYRKGTVHPTPPLVSDHLSFLPAAILTLAAALSQEDKEVLAYLISCSPGSGNFPGDVSTNRRNIHKLKTPNSASETAVSGAKSCSSAVSGGGRAERVLSGEFSGNRRNTHKLKTPNSATETSGGGTKGGAAMSGGVSGGADHPASFNCDCFSCYMSYWAKWDLSPNRQLIHEILDAYEEGLQSKKEKSKKERRNKNKGYSSNSSGSVELKKTSSESNLNINGSVPDGSGESDPVEETSGNHGGGDEDESGGEEGGEKGSVRKFVSFIGEKIWSVWT
ncbi:uncharacterized protein LOC107762962 [Nicotiana tabacum]|uniref:Uncharacterized protein LOC107762962 n=1 Tax=Nicotiana tabacum TaxID=4097 RepID=A0AC58S6W6_TOBAC